MRFKFRRLTAPARMAALVAWGLCIAAGSAADTTSPTLVSREYEMMSTFVEIKVCVDAKEADRAEGIVDKAQRDMQNYIDAVNTWDPSSAAFRVNANAGKAPVPVDRRLIALLEHARSVSELSGGAFDVTFMPLGIAWNLRTADFVVPGEEQIRKAKALVDYRDLVIDKAAGTAFLRRPGMRMELGSIAKGGAVNAAMASLKASGITSAIVRAGGDMYVLGTKAGQPWKIGIRDPRRKDQVLGRILLRDRAVTTSGDYERMVIKDGKRYSHIVDPRTGRPADKTVCVSVLAPDAETADAYSTAFFILGPVDGMALCRTLPGIDALFVDPDLKITRSPGFPEFVP